MLRWIFFRIYWLFRWWRWTSHRKRSSHSKYISLVVGGTCAKRPETRQREQIEFKIIFARETTNENGKLWNRWVAVRQVAARDEREGHRTLGPIVECFRERINFRGVDWQNWDAIEMIEIEIEGGTIELESSNISFLSFLRLRTFRSRVQLDTGEIDRLDEISTKSIVAASL